MAEESFVSNRSLFSGFRPATEWRNGCHYPARLCNLGLFCFCHVESAGGGGETYCFIREFSHPFEGTKEIYILSFPCYFATWPLPLFYTIHPSLFTYTISRIVWVQKVFCLVWKRCDKNDPEECRCRERHLPAGTGSETGSSGWRPDGRRS